MKYTVKARKDSVSEWIVIGETKDHPDAIKLTDEFEKDNPEYKNYWICISDYMPEYISNV